MEAPITGELVVRAADAAGPMTGPILVPVHAEGPGVYGSRRVVTQHGWADGRGRYDQWTVSPEQGVTDPSVFWEDQQEPAVRDHVMLTPAKPVDFEVRLDESLRFSKPGTYAVQLTTSRGGVRVRSEPVLVKVGAAGDVEARAAELLARIEAQRGAEQTDAFVQLALLGAPQSIEPGVAGLNDANQGSRWSLVLHAHPDRDAVRTKLLAVVEDAAAPVSNALIETLTALCYNDRYRWPIELPDKSQTDQARHQLERKERGAAATQCREEAVATVARAAPSKQGEARGVTMATLLRHRVLHGGEPSWGPTIATEAARSIEHVDAGVLRAWLTRDAYRSKLDAGAMAVSLEKLAVQPDERGDLALDMLHRTQPTKAMAIAADRFSHPSPFVLDDVAWILEAADPTPTQVDALMKAVDGSDLARLRLAARFAQPRHAEQWGALYAGLPADVKTPMLGAVVAGLLNTGHRQAGLGLDRYGTKHPQLLVEVARSARVTRPLVERAFRGVVIDDFEVSRGAAMVLADHMQASDRARLHRLGKKTDGKGEFGVAFAFATARAWVPTWEEINELGMSMQLPSATGFLETQSFRSKPAIVLKASEVRHQPAITFNGQVYVGEDEIEAKLKQLAPPNGVKFSFSGIGATENLARFEGYAKAAGLKIFED